MKAKVTLTDTRSGRCLNLITELTNTEDNRYEFTFDSLSDGQRTKIEKYFGKLNAYYTKAEIIKEYPVYRVEDTESGNYVLYEGTNKKTALNELKKALKDGTEWDLKVNSDLVWCASINSENELKNI